METVCVGWQHSQQVVISFEPYYCPRCQCHCHDRPIILWRVCVWARGILLTRSHSYILCSVRTWAHFEHILDLLTPNHCDHGENGNAYLLSIIKLIMMPRNNSSWIVHKTYFSGSKRSSWNEHSRPSRCFWGEQRHWFFKIQDKNSIFSDLAAHNWAVWPVCAECEESEETWCRETFKIGATGCHLKMICFLLIFYEKKRRRKKRGKIDAEEASKLELAVAINHCCLLNFGPNYKHSGK